MINTTDFTARLQQIMDYYGLTASAFADKLEIQRSSISHLLSERNKPSLDFILKLIEQFPDVDMYWITQGKGSFPPAPTTMKTSEVVKNQSVQTDLFGNPLLEVNIQKTQTEEKQSPKVVIEKQAENSKSKSEEPEKQIEKTSEIQMINEVSAIKNNGKKLCKIIFFYEDRSFEVFENK